MRFFVVLVIMSLVLGTFGLECYGAPKEATGQDATGKSADTGETKKQQADEDSVSQTIRERKWTRLEAHVRAKLDAAIAKVEMGDLEAALSAAEASLAADPTSAECIELVAQLKAQIEERTRLNALLANGEAERATVMAEIQKYLDENPVDVEALKAMAQVQEQAGDAASALKNLGAAVSLEHKNRNLYRSMARLYASLGDRSLKVFVDGQRPEFDVPPVIKDGRVLVPVRAIVEALGAEVAWNPDTREVTITKDATTIVLRLESATALVNGVETTLDVPANSINGRTVVPLRFLGESLQQQVEYDNDSGMVTIL